MHFRSTSLAFATLAPLLLGCALARPGLPAPEPGYVRVALEEVDASCRERGCTHFVRAGGAEHELDSDVQLTTPEEAIDEPLPGAGRQVLGAAGRELLRGVGFETTELMVGTGIRGVGDPDGRLNLVCDVVWLDEVTTTRVDGEDEVASERIVEGHSCTAGAPDDTLATWHFRSGLDPAREPLRRSLDSLAKRPAREPVDVVPMSLTRARPDDAGTLTYTIALESRTSVLPRYTWIVRRPDGSPVGKLLRSGTSGLHGVDVADGADEQEATVLRLIGVMLAVPLRE